MKAKTVDCLKHFLDALATSENGEHLSFFLKYMGVGRSVAESWWRGENKPKGLNLIKAALYLSASGYEIEDLSKNPDIVNMGKVLALELMSPEEASRHIGYNNSYDLYRVIMGSRNASKPVISNMAITNALYRAKLNEPFPVEKKPEERPDFKETDVLALANLISALGSLSLCLEPSLKRFFEDSSSTSRQGLRDAILEQGGKSLFNISSTVFRVGEILNALCTERAYSQIKKQ